MERKREREKEREGQRCTGEEATHEIRGREGGCSD
jgi:hypothetical protein